MVKISKTPEFDKWLHGLRDLRAFALIQKRLTRVACGNFGDYKAIGGKVFELRIDTGPGYRIYFFKRGLEYVILLVGGDKTSQSRDIETAKNLAKQYGA